MILYIILLLFLIDRDRVSEIELIPELPHIPLLVTREYIGCTFSSLLLSSDQI